MSATNWLLSAEERCNPHTRIDARHRGVAWTDGNRVQALVHGAVYFAQLLRRIPAMRAGDVLMFTDWRGDADERLAGPGTEVGHVLCTAAERGVIVKGLLWRSHLDRFSFSGEENREMGDEIEAAGGECLRDMRVRPGGSHHQKLLVLRHPGRPDRDVAFAGGIDLCHGRNDDDSHTGDPQRQPMAAVYGERPPWHDIQLCVRGPAVGDLEATFRERWEDPAALTRNPFDRVIDAVRREDEVPEPLPVQLPDPPSCGTQTVQVCFADALAANPQLRLVVVIPHYPDQDGRWALPPNLVGRRQALEVVRAAGGDRVAVYGVENHEGTPVYVHAKVCIVDDVWAAVGSDNVNRRSWTHDSELSCAVLDEQRDEREPRGVDHFGDGARRFARQLRLDLSREHLDRPDGDDADLIDPVSAFEQFKLSAQRLQDWHDNGRRGARPPGRLRPHHQQPLPRRTLMWAQPLFRTIYDPDGRPLRMRLRNTY